MSKVMEAKMRTADAGASNITAPTQFIKTRLETYAYRRFGKGAALRRSYACSTSPERWTTGIRR